MKKMDTRKKCKQGSVSGKQTEPLNPNRTRVHAQRKFAHPNGVASPTKEYKDLREKLNSNYEQKTRSGSTVANAKTPEPERPKTEDFLTFLCYRGTALLPQELEHFEIPNYAEADSPNYNLPNEDKPIKYARRKLEETPTKKSIPGLTKESVKRNLNSLEEAQITPKSRVTRSSASLTPTPSFMSSPPSVESSPEYKSKKLLKRKQMLLKKAMLMKSKNKIVHQRRKKLHLKGNVKAEPSRVTRSKIQPSLKSPIMPCRKTVKSSYVAKKKDSICRMLKRLGGTLVEQEPKSLSKTRSNKINPEVTVKVEASPPPVKRKTEVKSVPLKKAEVRVKTEPADTGYDLFDNALKTKSDSSIGNKESPDCSSPEPSTKRRVSSRLNSGSEIKSICASSPSNFSNDPQSPTSNENSSIQSQQKLSEKNKTNGEPPSLLRPSRKTKKVAQAFMEIVSQKLAKEERGSKCKNANDELSDEDVSIKDLKSSVDEEGKSTSNKLSDLNQKSKAAKRELRSQSASDKKGNSTICLRKSSPTRVMTSHDQDSLAPNSPQSTRTPSPRRSPSPKKTGKKENVDSLKNAKAGPSIKPIPKESLRNFKFHKKIAKDSSAKQTDSSPQVPCARVNRTASPDSPSKVAIRNTLKEVIPENTDSSVSPNKSVPNSLKSCQKLKGSVRRNSDEAVSIKKSQKSPTRRKSSHETSLFESQKEKNNEPVICIEEPTMKSKELSIPKISTGSKSLKIFEKNQTSSEESSSGTSSPIPIKKSNGSNGKKLIDVVKNLQQKKLAEVKTVTKGSKISKKHENVVTVQNQVSAEQISSCITTQAPAVHTMSAFNSTTEHSTSHHLETVKVPLPPRLLIPSVPNQNQDVTASPTIVSSVGTMSITPTKLSIPQVTKLPQGALLQVPTLTGMKSPITLLAPGIALHKNAKLSSPSNILPQASSFPPGNFNSSIPTSVQPATPVKSEPPVKAKQILIAPKPSKNPQIQSKNLNVPVIPAGLQKPYTKQISIAPKGCTSAPLPSNTHTTAPIITAQSMGQIMSAISRNVALPQAVHNGAPLPQAMQPIQALGQNFTTISGMPPNIQGVLPQTMALSQLGTPSSPAKIITQPVFVSSHPPNVIGPQFDLTNSLQAGLNQIKPPGPIVTPVTTPLVTLGSVSTGASLLPSFLPLNQPGQQPQFLTVNMMPVGGQTVQTAPPFRPLLCSQNMQCLQTVPKDPVTSASNIPSVTSQSFSTTPIEESLSSTSSTLKKSDSEVLTDSKGETSQPSPTVKVSSPIVTIAMQPMLTVITTSSTNFSESTCGKQPATVSSSDSSKPIVTTEPSPALSLALSKLYPLNEKVSTDVSKEETNISVPTINTHLYTTSNVCLPEITDHSTSRPKAVTQVSQSSPPYLLSTTTSEKSRNEPEKVESHLQSANGPCAPTRKVKRDPVKRVNLSSSQPTKPKPSLTMSQTNSIDPEKTTKSKTSLGKSSLEKNKLSDLVDVPSQKDAVNGQFIEQAKPVSGKVTNDSQISMVKEKKDTSNRKTLFKTKNKKDLKAPDAFSAVNESSVYAFEPEVESPLQMTKPFSSRVKKAQASSPKQALPSVQPVNQNKTTNSVQTVSRPSVEKKQLDRPKPKRAITADEVEALMKLGVSSCSSAEDETGDEEEPSLEIVSMTPVYSVPESPKQIPSRKMSSPTKKPSPMKTTKFGSKFGGRIPISQNTKRKTVLRVPMCKSPESRPLLSAHSASLASISSSLSLMSSSLSQSCSSKTSSTTSTDSNVTGESVTSKVPESTGKLSSLNNLKKGAEKVEKRAIHTSLDSTGSESPVAKKSKITKSPVESASIAIQCDLEESMEDTNTANESGTQTENPSKFPLPPSASPFYYLPLAMATLGEKLPAQLVQQMLAKTQGLVGVTEAGMILQQAAQLAQQYHSNSEQNPVRASTAKPISPRSGGKALQEALKASLSTKQLLATSILPNNESASVEKDEAPETSETIDEEPQKSMVVEDPPKTTKESPKKLDKRAEGKDASSLKRKSSEPHRKPIKKKAKSNGNVQEKGIRKEPMPVCKPKAEEPAPRRRSGRSSTSASTKATEFDMNEAIEIKRSRRARRAAVALSKEDGWSSSSENLLSPTMSPDSLRGWPSSRLTSPTPSQSSEGTTSSTPSYRSRFSNHHSRRQSPARGTDSRKLSRSSSMQQFPTDPVIEPKVVQVKENEKLTRAPSFFPSEEEFNEPLDYIEKIRPEAEQFGVCRIVPPSSFKPDCSVNDDMRFTVYQQYINRVMNRWGRNVKVLSAIRKCLNKQNIELSSNPLIGGVELDLVHLYEIVEDLGGLMSVIENQLWSKVADMLRIPRFAQDRLTKLDGIYCKYLLPYAMLSEEERQALLEEVTLESENKISAKTVGSNSGSDEESEDEDEPFEFLNKGKSTSLSAFYRVSRNIASQWQPDPDELDLDERYWNIVKERDRHVCVHTASIDTAEHGYGFPCNKNSQSSKHPWNLKNICQNPASILRSMQNVIGVSAPTLHIGMTFSTVCWYRDPHSLPWLEYLHTGACKIWYGVASTQEEKMKSALKKLVPDFVKDSPVWLPSDTTMVPPELLVDEGIRVCRIVQEPGQFVVVFPGAFTSSVCSGYLISESAFYAKPQYFDRAVMSFKMLRECCEPAMFSLDRLALSVASDSKASLESLVKARSYVADLVEKEKKQRLILKDIGVRTTERFGHQMSQKKKGRYVEEEEETLCETCGQHLYVSSVLNPEDDSTYCLEHATKLLTEKPRALDDWKILYSYSVSELGSTLKTMDDRISQKSVKHTGLKRVMNERQDSFSSNSSSTF